MIPSVLTTNVFPTANKKLSLATHIQFAPMDTYVKIIFVLLTIIDNYLYLLFFIFKTLLFSNYQSKIPQHAHS